MFCQRLRFRNFSQEGISGFFIDINERALQIKKSEDAYFSIMNIEEDDRDKLLKDYSHGM